MSEDESLDGMNTNLDDIELGGFTDDSESENDGEDAFAKFVIPGKENKENGTESSPDNQKKGLTLETKRNKQMLIKQFDLDEIKDFSEIPTNLEDEEDRSKESDTVADADKPRKHMKYELCQDPFFLDDNGNEIINPELDTEREKYRLVFFEVLSKI